MFRRLVLLSFVAFFTLPSFAWEPIEHRKVDRFAKEVARSGLMHALRDVVTPEHPAYDWLFSLSPSQLTSVSPIEVATITHTLDNFEQQALLKKLGQLHLDALEAGAFSEVYDHTVALRNEMLSILFWDSYRIYLEPKVRPLYRTTDPSAGLKTQLWKEGQALKNAGGLVFRYGFQTFFSLLAIRYAIDQNDLKILSVIPALFFFSKFSPPRSSRIHLPLKPSHSEFQRTRE